LQAINAYEEAEE